MKVLSAIRLRAAALTTAVVASSMVLAGCVGGAASAPEAGTTTLHLVGFAVPKEANNAIQKKFADVGAKVEIK